MKKLITYMAVTALALTVGSCYNDKSTVPDKNIPRVIIDNDAMPREFTVQQGQTVEIDTKARMEDGSPAEFSYRWFFELNPGWYQPDQLEFTEVVSTDPVFTHYVSEKPNGFMEYYQIMVIVTDNVTGQYATGLWEMTVDNGYGEGLIVAYDSDGGTDLGFISSNAVADNPEGEERVMTGIISGSTGDVLDGQMVGIVYTRNGFFAATNRSVYHIDNVDFSIRQSGEGMFASGDVTINPSQIFYSYPETINMVNGGELWSLSATEYEANIFSIPASGDYIISGPLTHSSRQQVPDGTFYNAADGKFQVFNYLDFSATGGVPVALSYPERGYTPVPGMPDPDNLPGMESLASRFGYQNRHYHLLKEEATGMHRIYTLTDNGISAVQELDAAGLAQARQFVFHPVYNVLYYRTESEVYRIYLDQAVLSPQLVYTAPSSETISYLSVYEQAEYLFSPGSVSTGNHHRMLLVGTFDGRNGTLHTLPNVGSAGGVDNSAMKSFTGFGKIVATVAQE